MRPDAQSRSLRAAADHEQLLRHELHRVDAVKPRRLLPQILRAAHRRETWLLVLVATAAAGVALILIGLLLLAWGQEQPAPAPSPTSTRLWEA